MQQRDDANPNPITGEDFFTTDEASVPVTNIVQVDGSSHLVLPVE